MNRKRENELVPSQQTVKWNNEIGIGNLPFI